MEDDRQDKPLTRFGVSMPHDLAKRFDTLIEEQGYENRSEAIRDLVRKALLEPSRLQADSPAAGTIVLVYDHHVGELPQYLTQVQHDYHHHIISTMHIHLSHHECLEIIVVRGAYGKLKELQAAIQGQKGVLYAELSVTHAERRHTE